MRRKGELLVEGGRFATWRNTRPIGRPGKEKPQSPGGSGAETFRAHEEGPPAVEALRDRLDAMLFRAGCLDLVTAAASGGTAVEAALRAVTALSGEAPGLRVHRLDRELVGVQEIAERTGRTRQNVAQWVRGERLAGNAPFPSPEGTAGRSPVWLWTEVNSWLDARDLGDGCTYPTRQEMLLIDHALLASTMPRNAA
jgi:predicted DNA-binding transcriptional regulator AlpA